MNFSFWLGEEGFRLLYACPLDWQYKHFVNCVRAESASRVASALTDTHAHWQPRRCCTVQYLWAWAGPGGGGRVTNHILKDSWPNKFQS